MCDPDRDTSENNTLNTGVSWETNHWHLRQVTLCKLSARSTRHSARLSPAQLGSGRPCKASLHSAAAAVSILPLFIRHYGSITQKQKGIKHLSEPAYFTQQGKGHIWAVGISAGNLTSCLPLYPDRWGHPQSEEMHSFWTITRNNTTLTIWVRGTDTSGNWLAYC